MRAMKLLACLIIFWCDLGLAETKGQYQGTEPNVELRISVDRRIFLGEREMEKMAYANKEEGIATLKENSIPILRGESIQLMVELIEPDGLVTDVTNSAKLIYNALGRINLKANSSGLVTALPNENPFALGKVFIIYNTPEKSGYNKIFFDIKSPAHSDE